MLGDIFLRNFEGSLRQLNCIYRLAAGENGLEIVREIIEFAPNYLTENGVLVCEVGFSRENLERHFARLPFNWLDFERGGEGVFCLQKQDLIDHL